MCQDFLLSNIQMSRHVPTAQHSLSITSVQSHRSTAPLQEESLHCTMLTHPFGTSLLFLLPQAAFDK